MKYRIGEKVRVKKPEPNSEADNDGYAWVKKLDKYIGTIHKIERYEEEYVGYYVDGIDDNTLHETWLEPVEPIVEKKYKVLSKLHIFNDTITDLTDVEFPEGHVITTNELINAMIDTQLIQEVQTKKAYFLGDMKLVEFSPNNDYYIFYGDKPSDKRLLEINGETFQSLLSQGIITEKEVEVC